MSPVRPAPPQILQSQDNVPRAAVDHNGDTKAVSGKNAPVTQPKPPRSAFMCFTDAKKKAIMSMHGSEKVRYLLRGGIVGTQD